MAWALGVAVVLVGLFAGVSLWWRQASRRQPLPCPAWLSWMLTNPLAEGGGSARILDHLSLSPGMRVLDVGCGPGRLSVPAAERVGPDGVVLALDVQAAMLKKLVKRAAARGVTNIQTLEGPIEQAALAPGTCDRALLVAVLGEVPDRVAALQRIFTALKPGGVLSVTETLTDPHYQRLATVRQLGQAAGFQPGQYYGGWLSYTLHLVKPLAA
jgi:ubiquinone/menaquinone biosynthesis C-methylase UbiE